MKITKEFILDILKKHQQEKELTDKELNVFAEIVSEELNSNFELKNSVWRIYERECHEEDVREELYYQKGWNGIGTPPEINENDIRQITNLYEDYLGNDDTWHILLKETLCKFSNE